MRKETQIASQELRFQIFEIGHLKDMGIDIKAFLHGQPMSQPYVHGRFSYTWESNRWKVLDTPIKAKMAVMEVKGKEVAVIDWDATFSEENIADLPSQQ